MDQENDYFDRPGRRSTNGRIVQIEGVPRRSALRSSNFTHPTVVTNSSLPQQQQHLHQQVPSNASNPSDSLGVDDLINKQDCHSFDDVIARVGTNGKYQQALLYYVISPFCVIQPILAFNAVFMLFTPDHWCSSPDMKNWDDQEEYKLVNIPMENGTDGIMKYSSCTMYGPDQIEVTCPYGWQYDKSYYDQTMVSENGWVCDKAKIPTYVLLAGTVGNAIGTLVFGLLSDNWGRRKSLFLSLVMNVFFRILSLFSGSHWYILAVAQFFSGTTTTFLYVGSAMIVAEMCNKDERGKVYAVTWTVCLFGYVILPFIAWLCANWFLIGLATAGMGCCMLVFYPVIPESPRWLVQKGRVDEAAEILKKVQDYNIRHAKKKTKPINMIDQEGESQERQRSFISYGEDSLDYIKCLLKQVLERQHNAEERLSVAEGRGAKLEDRSKATVIFAKRNLAKNTLLLTICWSMNALIYSTMTYNSTHMSGSHFINFFLLGIIEVPSGIFGGYLADTLGRRWTQSLSFGLCALSCFATSIMVHQRELEVLLATLSKLLVTGSFLVAFCQATELFPTELRSTGSGIASTIANVFSIASPVISDLSSYSAAYPWVAMGIFSIVGMVAGAFLPETLNLRLPETIDEANSIGKNRKFWSIVTPEMKRSSEKRHKQSKKCVDLD